MEVGFLDLLSEIPGVGRERARRLVSEGFSSIDSLVSADIEDIAMAAGIGLGPATELREFFRSRYLQDPGPILCSACGCLARSEGECCPSCGAIMPAAEEVAIKSLESLLAETEKDVRVADEATLEDVDFPREEEPGDLASVWLEGLTRQREGEQVPIARIKEQIGSCDSFLEIDPTSESTWLRKAKLLLELGRYEEAIECSDKASELNPEMEEQHKTDVLNALRPTKYLPIALGPAGDTAAIEIAIRHYEGLLRLDPTYKMAWQTKGELLEKLDMHDKAIECYDEAIRYATLERTRDIRAMARLSRHDVWSRRSISRGMALRIGRSNGLINGLSNGRINGLINGFSNGRINGLINGFVNGVGRVNGLINGLINGDGFVNGKARRARFMGFPEGPVRWTRGLATVATILALLIVMPSLDMILFGPDRAVIEIDGSFGDWSEISTRSSPFYFDDTLDQLDNPDVNIVTHRLLQRSNFVYLYAQVEGSLFRGTGPDGIDNVFLFVDGDADASTGYKAGDLGADHLVHLQGWNNSCTSGRLLEFSSSRGRDNWHGFRTAGNAPCAANNDRLEAVFSFVHHGFRTLLATKDMFGNADLGDSVVTVDRGALTVDVETIAPEIVTQSQFPVLSLGLSIQATALDSLTLNLSKQGNLSDDVVTLALYEDSDLNHMWDATDLLIDSSSISNGSVQFNLDRSSSPMTGNITLFAVATLSSMPQSSSFGLRLDGVAANSTVLIREGFLTNSYVLAPPQVTIDGAFADWNGTYESDGNDDVIRIGSSASVNENIDLRNYSLHRAGNVSVYLDIDRAGRMLGGDLIPAFFDRPPPYIPPYLDSDLDTVPDDLDGPLGMYRLDFDNDGTTDIGEGGDVDSDGELDYPFGGDYWLETVLPSNFTAPYADQSIRVYIGPMPADVSEGMDRVVVYVDRDGPGTGLRTIVDSQLIGYDFMLLVTGKGGEINTTGVYAYNQSAAIPWELTYAMDAAVDSSRMELGVPAQILNLTDAFVTHVFMIDWTRSYDRTDGALTNSTSRSRTRSPEGDDIVLNEIRADKKRDEWIELANPTDGEIDISGWELVVDGTTIYTFPAGTTLGAFGSGSDLLVQDFSGDLIPDGGANVRLMNGTTNVDETDYPSHKTPESWSRFRESETGKPIDTDDPDDWYVSTSPTKGEPNDRTKPSMVVKKVADKTSAAPGEEVVYTLYYNNTGSTKTRNVWLNDTLPDGVTYISSSRAYTSRSGNTYRWNFGTVPRKSENSLTITVSVNDTVDDLSVLGNFVTLNYTNDDGVWQAGSDSNVSFTCSRPIISVVKTVDKSEALPGDTLVYTIYYNNTGSGNAGHVWVNDTLPNNVTYQGSSEAYESQNGNTYIWHFTDVAPGSHSFTITVTVDLDVPPGIILVNWAFLNYTTQNSYGLEESSGSAMTYIPEFQDLVMPLLTIFLVFIVVRRRSRKRGG